MQLQTTTLANKINLPFAIPYSTKTSTVLGGAASISMTKHMLLLLNTTSTDRTS